MQNYTIFIPNVIPNFHDCHHIRVQQQVLGNDVKAVCESLKIKEWEYRLEQDLVLVITNDVPINRDEITKELVRRIK